MATKRESTSKKLTTILAEAKRINGKKYDLAEKDTITLGSNNLPLTKESKFIMDSMINVIDDLYTVDVNKHNTIVNDIDSIAVANLLSKVPVGMRTAIKAPGSIAIFNKGHSAPFWVIAHKTSGTTDPKAYIFESKEQEAHLHDAAVSSYAYMIRQDLDDMHEAGNPNGKSIPSSELSASTNEYTAKMSANVIP
jgi:hypothetical protein